MVLPELAAGTDVALFLLRLLLASLFASSGQAAVRAPEERGESIGLRPAFAFALGGAELAGAFMLAVGLLTQLAALALMVVMLGALYKKIFRWQKGFFADGEGWFYELLYLVCLLLVVTTGGGAIAVT